jgi:PDZ domain
MGLGVALALSSLYAQQGVIGIEFAGDPAVGARLEAEAVTGIRLRQVQPGSVAAAAGLRVGDLIVAINGQRVQADSLNPGQPTRRAGATLDLMVLREGVAMPMRLTVGFPPGEAPAPAPPVPVAAPPPPVVTSRAAPIPQPGFAVGRITLPDGSPLPASVVGVRIWINGVTTAGRDVSYEPLVQPDGIYRQALAAGQYRFSTGYVSARHGGKTFEVPLEFVGDLATRSRDAADGLVQDFVWKATGATARALALGPDPSNHTHWYGTRIATSPGGWRGDFDDRGGRVNRSRADRLIPEGSKVTLTLRPLTASIDGRAVAPVTIERLVPGNVGANFHDLAPADYELTGVATLPDGRRTPLTFRGSEENRLGFVRAPRVNLAWDTVLQHYFERQLVYFLEEFSGTPAAAAPAAALAGLTTGSKVEVQWNGRWFPATIKAVNGPGRWMVAYDGYGSQWDEVVGPDRLRLPTAPAAGPARAAATAATARPATLAWPAVPPGAQTPIAGAFMTVRMWMNGAVTIEAWFFTSNGRFSRSPSGGLTLAELAAKPDAGKEEGTYRIENGELIMDWADGRAPWRSSYEGHEKSLSIGGQFASRQSGFVRGWRLDGAYEGGASVGGGAVSSSNTLRFRLDGTFSRAGVVNISSIGRTSEVSGGATSGASGTYEFDEFSLTLRENGAESRVTVLMFGAVDQAGRPEQMFYGGGMLRRQ